MIALRFSSALAAPADTVWQRACTMAGVNEELGPWLRMSYPHGREDLLAQTVPLGETLFQSWILLLGLLPLDRHALALQALYPRGFDERSGSWMQRVWIHRRRIEGEGAGCRVTDELEFQPRLALFAPLLRLVVTATFRHRHRQLRHRYGRARA